MLGDDERRTSSRPSLKTHTGFNNFPNWKDRLRENCCKRVREDRARLLWKFRLPEAKDQSPSDKEFIKSTFQCIVSDEFNKIKDTSSGDCLGAATSDLKDGDALWDYDGFHMAYQGECEEILLEMQRIFYEDLRMEPSKRESDNRMWEDEEDEYLARAVYEHMQLSDEQVHKIVWCPICKQGQLQENYCDIYCTICELKLKRDNEVTLDLLRIRLAEAHAEHLERGCRLKPKFCFETRYALTALYIECQGCSTFEVII